MFLFNRKVVWKHLLNVYPEGLTGRERLDYMKKKTQEYESLKNVWQEHMKNEEKVWILFSLFYFLCTSAFCHAFLKSVALLEKL